MFLTTDPHPTGLRYCMNSASLTSNRKSKRNTRDRNARNPRQMRILLAEDDPMIGASVRRGLAQDGFAVDWVEDGRAANWRLPSMCMTLCCSTWGCRDRAGSRC